MRPIWNPSDIDLCNLADGIQRPARLTDRWRVNRRRLRRFVRDQASLRQPRFFCQNSGACGSTYLVQLLVDNGIPRCFHEKSPDLNSLGVEHFDDPIGADRLTSLLRYTRWDVFFEANNRLFSLTKELAAAFPGARFIQLFRDARLAVESAMSKPDLDQYLAQNIRFQGSLAGSPKDSHLARFCHYWNNMNRRILSDMEQVDCGPVFYLSLADLKAGRVEGLANFMGIELPIHTRSVVNQGRLGKSGRYPPFDHWPKADQQLFWDICGETFEELNRRHEKCHQDSSNARAAS